jgi:NAD(P)-dependent dehydrogenase (short-subunit alcohol dehydrogenase family)
MEDLRGRGAAITGAGSGIGRALALRLAREGCHVAIADVDEKGLSETARLVGAHGGRVDRTTLDVADRLAVQAWADRIAAQFGSVYLVVNNAGVSLSAAAEAMSREDLEWIMAINFYGVVNGSMAFLPHLKRAGEGCIVNLSSVLGLVGLPLHAGYVASKFAVRGFTEVLGQELEAERSGVRAVCVHPGGVRTALVRSGRFGGSAGFGVRPDEVIAGFERLAKLSPERAADAIVRGVKRRRSRILVGADARLADWADRLSHAGLRRWIVWRTRRRLLRSNP